MAATKGVSTAAAILAAAAVVLMVVGGAAAQQPSASGCTQTLIGMSPCLNYITGNETAPSRSCCSQLAAVTRSQPECLCVALTTDPAALGIGSVNRTRALGLPDQCNVQTPPVSNCKSAASPPSPSSSGTPDSAGTGSKSTPTTFVGNGGVSLRGSAGVVAGFVVAAVYAASVL